MKVILIKDVARLGRKSEIKEVPDGHAINFLIPRKLAIIATPEGTKRVLESAHKHEAYVQNNLKTFEEALRKMESGVPVYTTDANAQGHLFKGVSAENIATHLHQAGYPITKANVELAHPIKELGTHEIRLVHGTVHGVCRLEIVKK